MEPTSIARFLPPLSAGVDELTVALRAMQSLEELLDPVIAAPKTELMVDRGNLGALVRVINFFLELNIARAREESR